MLKTATDDVRAIIVASLSDTAARLVDDSTVCGSSPPPPPPPVAPPAAVEKFDSLLVGVIVAMVVVLVLVVCGCAVITYVLIRRANSTPQYMNAPPASVQHFMTTGHVGSPLSRPVTTAAHGQQAKNPYGQSAPRTAPSSSAHKQADPHHPQHVPYDDDEDEDAGGPAIHPVSQGRPVSEARSPTRSNDGGYTSAYELTPLRAFSGMSEPAAEPEFINPRSPATTRRHVHRE
uniref:Uncharacterized protein n=1 Tax=Tetraselmis chuii TaxID=63592 RepID=A0A7S1SJY2_9CHLO|mmetsp:Transcript_14785/g.26158  ORF Transcript_14785/g.26158 Transcript_14785/m.26158 type:complete len:232 (+) Transcript_14785:500-1195(+)